MDLGDLAGPFAVGTFSTQDAQPFPGLLADHTVLDLRSLPSLWRNAAGEPSTRALFEHWTEVLPVLAEAAGTTAQGRWLTSHDLRVHPPVEPRQVFHAGANYRRHVLELTLLHQDAADPRSPSQIQADIEGRAVSGEPYVFAGLPSSLTGAYDDVALPGWTAQPDWELELCAVIGARAFRVTPQEALQYVAGYTIANDLTARDALFRKDVTALGADWLRAKNAPGFTPVGPCVVPSAFAGDVSSLHLELKLNGTVMQDDTTADMIFDTARLISFISQTSPLLPGDLVLTGSPAGNGVALGRLLVPGDEIEARITGLGRHHTRFIPEGK